MSGEVPIRVQEADTGSAGEALARIQRDFERQWLEGAERFHAETAAAAGLGGPQGQAARGAAAARLAGSWHRAIDDAFPAAHAVGGRVWPNPSPAAGDGLAQMVKAQKRFASRFAFDLLAGHVGARNRMPFGQRSAMYSAAIEGAYQLGAVESSPDGEAIWWRLSACKHCVECPSLAANSPYTKATLPCVPRDGSTPCRSRCRCYLEFRRAGAAGSGAPAQPGDPGQAPQPAPSVPQQPAVPSMLPGAVRPSAPTRTPPSLVERATGEGPEPPPGLRRPTAPERRVLRDLETRMNRARRAAERAANAGLDAARDRFLARRRDLNAQIIDFTSSRRIHHVPTWDVGEVITAADVRGGEIDTLTHLRGIDGTTIHRAQAAEVQAVLAEAEAELKAALREYPIDVDGVPNLDELLRLVGAPESALGGELSPVVQSFDLAAWNVGEALAAVEVGPAEGEQVVNVVGRSSAASLQSLLDAVRVLRTTGDAVEIGPLDDAWLDLVAAAGWWLRGEASAVEAFIASLGPTIARWGLEIAPWQGGGG